MDRTAAIIVVMMSGFMLGAEAVTVLSQDGFESGNPPFAFVTPSILYGNVFLFGIHQGNMSSPVRIKEVGLGEAGDVFLWENITMGDIGAQDLPRIAEQHDIVILPFQINIDVENVGGIWVENSSNITDPNDLQGKTIGGIKNQSVMSINILHALYDVDVEFSTKWNSSVAWYNASTAFLPRKRLAHREIDAVFMMGQRRLPDNHSLRPVFLPFKELETRFGDAAFPVFFVVKDRPGTVEQGFRLIEDLQRSSRYAQTYRQLFMQLYTICNEFLVGTSQQQIQAMTPEALAALQFVLDSMYQQREVEHRVNLSELVVRKDIWVQDSS